MRGTGFFICYPLGFSLDQPQLFGLGLGTSPSNRECRMREPNDVKAAAFVPVPRCGDFTITTDDFTIKKARYAKGEVLVKTPAGEGFFSKSHAGRLAECLGGRYTDRERGYVMSPGRAEALQRYLNAGYTGSWVSTTIEKR